MKAWDLELSPTARRDHPDALGWCFGLPPGIAPGQWPLDPNTGYPMQHGFTLRLPEGYAAPGSDVHAIAFFGTPADQNDGGPVITPGVRDVILSPEATAPADADLRVLWEQARGAHPRLHRMWDILDLAWAVVPLTEDEFDGPPCPVPETHDLAILRGVPRPGWLDGGSALATWRFHGDWALTRPEAGRRVTRTILATARANDPNAGKKPVASWDVNSGGYVDAFDPDTFEILDWAKGFGPNHLGGTMMPSQGIPPGVGPAYIEFGEDFGGWNFGGGNAQLDLRSYAFDWAQ
ncbi:hypothetical protein [Jannaschia marina]|uniref:hypothetical protein n=1 Tax=Jannaschia marina TaxID=2741674 RepID=UPI0015CE65DC|nr:hypothetical protein [Jannaschia marina]